jgi:hypothetical protein
MAENLRRKVLTSKEIADLLEHLRTLPKEEQQFDHEVRHNRILSDMVEIPKWRARFSELSPEDQERIERVEKVHAQEISIHKYIGRELGLIDPPAGQSVLHFRFNDIPVNLCIKAARAMEVRIAEEKLAALSVKWERPMSGVTLIDRHANARTILLQVALLPITSILILVLVLLTPFMYLSDLRQLGRKTAALTDEIRRLRASPLPPNDPSVRTLQALWSHCGINNALHPSAKLDLLCEWVDIFYGPGYSAELKIRERAREIGRRNVHANLPYYEGKGAPRWFFQPPVDTLITELSDELPPFRVSESRHDAKYMPSWN